MPCARPGEAAVERVIQRCSPAAERPSEPETGEVFEQKVTLEGEDGTRLEVRRILLRLNVPTRDGEIELAVLTNVPAASCSGSPNKLSWSGPCSGASRRRGQAVGREILVGTVVVVGVVVYIVVTGGGGAYR